MGKGNELISGPSRKEKNLELDQKNPGGQLSWLYLPALGCPGLRSPQTLFYPHSNRDLVPNSPSCASSKEARSLPLCVVATVSSGQAPDPS